MKKQVAIQGIIGSYHEIAARKFFREENIDIIGCGTFCDVILTVKRQPDILGVMAIENTIAGSLLQNHELVRKSGLTVIGEYKLRISHCLAALPGTSIEDVMSIGSHPMALMQCETFLSTLHSVQIIEKEDTATSARQIAEQHLERQAAICSREAAQIYGLEILAEAVETNKHNFTRFLVLATSDFSALADKEKSKASIVFALPHTIGSLSQVLAVLSFYSMNLSKIQSFPMIGTAWEYLFYVDLTFADYSRYKKALDAILPLTKNLRILGEYKEFTQPQ
ncbi:MAG: prephenate dehydratase [Planctomycetaceae bacterium]|jgi:prephenate dehydratase|nr:prephenate dehydratase [Planctomycetaceae bacterium]